MVKRWRSYLSLLVSFAFILSMLFLDILKVDAYGLDELVKSPIFAYPSSPIYFDNVYVDYLSESVFLDNDEHAASTQISQNYAYVKNYQNHVTGFNNGHVSVPYVFQFGDIGSSAWDAVINRSDWDPDAYYLIQMVVSSPTYSFSDGSTVRSCTFSNQYFKTSDGAIAGKSVSSATASAPTVFVKGRDMLGSSSSTTALNLFGIWEFDYNISNIYSKPEDINDDLRLICHPNFSFTVWSLKDDYKYNIGSINVNDYVTQQNLTDLNTSTDAIEDSTTNPNGTGILGTIKNFFGGFFDWLKELLLGLFIPDSDYFSTWFTNLNNLLSVKLGMLYAPFDLLITILNAVYSSSTDFSGVPFPEIKWGDTVLVGSQNLTFSSLLGEHFSEIQGYVYFATDVVLLFAFLMLLQRKVCLILRGHESG